MTQKERIIDYLKTHKEIDRLTALVDIGIFELSARICELKRQGYNFEIIPRQAVNKYGEVFNFKSYRLVNAA